MKVNTLTWISFDLDGTLVDTAVDICAALNCMLTHYKLPHVDVADVKTWIGNGIGKATELALIKVNGHTINIDSAVKFVNEAYNNCITDSSQLYSNALTTLQVLSDKGLKLLLVTNKNEAHTYALINKLAIKEYFDAVICGDSLPQRKPDPAMLFHVLHSLDLNIKEGFYVGDSKNDVATARQAGCPVVTVDYGYNHGLNIVDSKPDMLISNLSEIVKILKA